MLRASSRSYISIVTIASLVVAALIQSAAPASGANARTWTRQKPDLGALRDTWVKDEVLVQFRRGTSRSSARQLLAGRGARFVSRFEAPGLGAVDIARVSSGRSVWGFARQLRSLPAVRHAEPNLVRKLYEIPNDTSFTQLWGINNTGQAHGLSEFAVSPENRTASGTADADADVAEAWDTQKGDPSVVIGVLDSGVDAAHPDLVGSMWMNDGEIAGNSIDDDGNGFVDDVNGYDFARDRGAPLVESNTNLFGYDHGTHVAGIVAATSGNAMGVAGVCPQCKIMALKFGGPGDSDGDGVDDIVALDLAAELQGLAYAADNGADIVNGSFGGPIFYTKLERNVFNAIGKQGVLSVIATGNSNGDNDLILAADFDQDGQPDSLSPNYPASYNLPTILSVAASNHKDELANSTACVLDGIGADGGRDWPCSFTNWGHDSADVAGPGVDILSTLPGNAYAFFDGTSMASPFVAGVAGLVKSEHPTYTPEQIRNAILNSAETPASLNQLFAYPSQLGVPEHPATGDFLLTGRVNANDALTASTAALPKTDGNIDGASGIAGSKSGGIAWPEDVNDLFKKKLKKGAVYRATLVVPPGKDFDLWVLKPGTTEIHQLEDGCFPGGAGGCRVIAYDPKGPGADETFQFRAKKSGVHYFQVQAFLFEAGNYTLKVKKL